MVTRENAVPVCADIFASGIRAGYPLQTVCRCAEYRILAGAGVLPVDCFGGITETVPRQLHLPGDAVRGNLTTPGPHCREYHRFDFPVFPGAFIVLKYCQ